MEDQGELALYAVRVQEKGPAGPEWLLYTNVPVLSLAQAKELIASYQGRWRVEEFHRARGSRVSATSKMHNCAPTRR